MQGPPPPSTPHPNPPLADEDLSLYARAPRTQFTATNCNNECMYHEPIGGLLRPDAQETSEACAAPALDDVQLEHFKTNGFVAGVRVLDEDQVSRACSCFRTMNAIHRRSGSQVNLLRRELDALVAEGGRDKRW